MLKNTEAADPHASANRFRARARACRRVASRLQVAWGRFAFLEAHGGPHTLAVLHGHRQYRRMVALRAEAEYWDGAARRIASMHAEAGHYPTWRAPLVHTEVEIPAEEMETA